MYSGVILKLPYHKRFGGVVDSRLGAGTASRVEHERQLDQGVASIAEGVLLTCFHSRELEQNRSGLYSTASIRTCRFILLVLFLFFRLCFQYLRCISIYTVSRETERAANIDDMQPRASRVDSNRGQVQERLIYSTRPVPNSRTMEVQNDESWKCMLHLQYLHNTS